MVIYGYTLVITAYNTFTQGAEGAICQPPDVIWKEAGANGYIFRFVSVCNYALCCNHTRSLFYTQKIAPLSW